MASSFYIADDVENKDDLFRACGILSEHLESYEKLVGKFQRFTGINESTEQYVSKFWNLYPQMLPKYLKYIGIASGIFGLTFLFACLSICMMFVHPQTFLNYVLFGIAALLIGGICGACLCAWWFFKQRSKLERELDDLERKCSHGISYIPETHRNQKALKNIYLRYVDEGFDNTKKLFSDQTIINPTYMSDISFNRVDFVPVVSVDDALLADLPIAVETSTHAAVNSVTDALDKLLLPKETKMRIRQFKHHMEFKQDKYDLGYDCLLVGEHGVEIEDTASVITRCLYDAKCITRNILVSVNIESLCKDDPSLTYARTLAAIEHATDAVMLLRLDKGSIDPKYEPVFKAIKYAKEINSSTTFIISVHKDGKDLLFDSHPELMQRCSFELMLDHISVDDLMTLVDVRLNDASYVLGYSIDLRAKADLEKALRRAAVREDFDNIECLDRLLYKAFAEHSRRVEKGVIPESKKYVITLADITYAIEELNV